MDIKQDIPHSDKYKAFVAKFEPKKTTDDCYTPPAIYAEVLAWLGEQTDISGREIVRPFQPSGDYTTYPYPDNCIVVDNPPFSILEEITRYYIQQGIDFFLFTPGLTTFSSRENVCHIVCGITIVYHNGAKVNTSFRTSLFSDTRVWVAGDLHNRINRVQMEQMGHTSPKYQYPDHIITAARLNKISNRGVSLRIAKSEAEKVSSLDSQRQQGKALFGGGYILGNDAAARLAAAIKQAEQVRRQVEQESLTIWELSDKERAIILELDKAN